MIFHFLLLKAPVISIKRFENSPASVKSMTGENEVPRSVVAFPGRIAPVVLNLIPSE